MVHGHIERRGNVKQNVAPSVTLDSHANSHETAHIRGQLMLYFADGLWVTAHCSGCIAGNVVGRSPDNSLFRYFLTDPLASSVPGRQGKVAGSSRLSRRISSRRSQTA
ncbi:protein of unknown function [Paraburkholderia kururiensis]